MNRIKKGIIGTVLLALILVFALLPLFPRFPPQSEGGLQPELIQGTSAATDLGFTYLPVTPRVSAYYDLGVDSGALVTEVIPDSPAARAGVEVGDVVLSFNGARVEETAPLLGMMMACPAEHEIVFEVWHGGSLRVVEFTHVER